MKGYWVVSDLVNDNHSEMFADSHNTLHRWKNYFNQLLNLDGVNYVRWIERYTAETLAPEHRCFEV